MRRVDREKYPHLYEKHLKFGRTLAGRAQNKRAVDSYLRSEKGRKVRSAYQASNIGQQVHRKACKNYRNTFDGMMTLKFWNKGLSESERIRAFEAFQNFDGRCYACGTLDPGTKNGWHLDHKGDKFRGILCHGCNVGAAMLKDSPLRCDLLGTYLINFIRKQGQCLQLGMSTEKSSSTEK